MRHVYPEELLDEALKLLKRRDLSIRVCGRAVAFLVRQALEQLLTEVWRKRAPGLERVSMRAQLICLPEYLRDQDLAHRVSSAYGALSQACHYHLYELAPSESDLRHWIGVVAALAKQRKLRGV